MEDKRYEKLIQSFHETWENFPGQARLIDKNHHVRIYRAKHIKMHRETAGPMHIDGDPINMPNDLDIRCHEGGIRIFVGEKGENNRP